MKLAIASGKGGTGKTTVAVNLARSFRSAVQLLDCDVEEPNVHLFFDAEFRHQETVTVQVPEIDEHLCNACGECSRFCEFHAIATIGSRALVFPEMCHSCGGCMKLCPQGAIHEVLKRIGVIETADWEHVRLIHGRLDIGVAMAPPLIRAVKSRVDPSIPVIFDAPPGTSCPVITTMRESDYVILVTEPTPFGLHDLGLAVDVARELGIPFGVLINRAGSGDGRVHDYCRNQGIPIVLEIPDDRRIAEAYSRGRVMVEVLPEYREMFGQLRAMIEGMNLSGRNDNADL